MIVSKKLSNEIGAVGMQPARTRARTGTLQMHQRAQCSWDTNINYETISIVCTLLQMDLVSHYNQFTHCERNNLFDTKPIHKKYENCDNSFLPIDANEICASRTWILCQSALKPHRMCLQLLYPCSYDSTNLLHTFWANFIFSTNIMVLMKKISSKTEFWGIITKLN